MRKSLKALAAAAETALKYRKQVPGTEKGEEI